MRADIGYWDNEEKTNEVMIRDEEGRLWMITGDEGSMDKDGYLSITGRIKDIIIRGNPPPSHKLIFRWGEYPPS